MRLTVNLNLYSTEIEAMKERVSAFIDGETGHQESLDVIRALDNDVELRKQWHRYHVYGHVLRDELSTRVSANFTSNVTRALAEEPVQLAPSAMKRRKPFRGPVAGMAVAASLVAVAVLVFNPSLNNQQETGTAPTLVAKQTSTAKVAAQPAANYDQDDLIVANSKNENVRERINRLLVQHNQYNPASDMTGIMPYSRFVGFNPGADRR
jgi:negative regulator of sigma E activity